MNMNFDHKPNEQTTPPRGKPQGSSYLNVNDIAAANKKFKKFQKRNVTYGNFELNHISNVGASLKSSTAYLVLGNEKKVDKLLKVVANHAVKLQRKLCLSQEQFESLADANNAEYPIIFFLIVADAYKININVVGYGTEPKSYEPLKSKCKGSIYIFFFDDHYFPMVYMEESRYVQSYSLSCHLIKSNESYIYATPDSSESTSESESETESDDEESDDEESESEIESSDDESEVKKKGKKKDKSQDKKKGKNQKNEKKKDGAGDKTPPASSTPASILKNGTPRSDGERTSIGSAVKHSIAWSLDKIGLHTPEKGEAERTTEEKKVCPWHAYCFEYLFCHWRSYQFDIVHIQEEKSAPTKSSPPLVETVIMFSQA